MGKKVAIEVKDLVVGYKESKKFTPLTKPFSFSIEKGSLVAIVGVNGTGKSTLINSISGSQMYQGEVLLSGKDIKAYKALDLAKNLSSVNTHYQVQSYTRVYDVISKGRSVHTNWLGKLKDNDKSTVVSAAKKVGVEDLLNRFYNTLSDGEKQRTLLAMALAQQAEVIVLDEPTAFVDYPNKYFLTSILKEICEQENKTILFSSHDLEVVMNYADFVLMMNGESFEFLSKMEFLKRDKLSVLFEKNLIPDTFKDKLINNLLDK